MLIKFCFPGEIERDDVSSNAENEFRDFNIENYFERQLAFMMEMSDTENMENSENLENSENKENKENSENALRNAPRNAPIAEDELEIDSE